MLAQHSLLCTGRVLAQHSLLKMAAGAGKGSEKSDEEGSGAEEASEEEEEDLADWHGEDGERRDVGREVHVVLSWALRYECMGP